MEHVDKKDGVLCELSRLDIGGCSLLHYFFTRAPVQKVTFLKSYFLPWLITAFLFYGLPLLVALVKVPNILFDNPTSGLKVGFLGDWNIMFMYLVTLPVLVILMLSERSAVASRIAGVIQLRQNSRAKPMVVFVDFWNNVYKIVNIMGQFASVAVAVAVVLANYKTALMDNFNGWGVTQGAINPSGWIYLCWQLPLFYWIVGVYISQGLATVALLFSLTRNFEVAVSPFHHDNCCGLRAVARTGLRNQYLLAVVGMNLLALVAVNVRRGFPGTVPLLIAGALAYLIFGPVVFIGPLLPFRKSMLSAKEEEQAKVATRLQQEYTRIVNALAERSMTKEDEEAIDRLEKLKALVNRIPVWPFDGRTVGRFFTAYIVPVLTGLLSWLISYLQKIFAIMFPS